MITRYNITVYVDEDGCLWTKKELKEYYYKITNTEKHETINGNTRYVDTINKIRIVAKQQVLF